MTYANEREHVQFHDVSLRGFVQFVLVSVGVRKPTEFPLVETMSNEVLENTARKLHHDAQWNDKRGVKRPRHSAVHARASAYKSSVANQIDNYLGSV